MDDLREFIAFKISFCTLMGAKALQGKENGQLRLRIKLCLQGQLSQTGSELVEKPGLSTSPPPPWSHLIRIQQTLKQREKQTYRILRFLIPAKSTFVILVMLFLFRSLQGDRRRETIQVISQHNAEGEEEEEDCCLGRSIIKYWCFGLVQQVTFFLCVYFQLQNKNKIPQNR